MVIWNVRYYIDPETGLPHIYNHSVTEEEMEEVLARPGEDRRDLREPGWPLDRLRQGDTCGSYMCLTLSQVVCS